MILTLLDGFTTLIAELDDLLTIRNPAFFKQTKPLRPA